MDTVAGWEPMTIALMALITASWAMVAAIIALGAIAVILMRR